MKWTTLAVALAAIALGVAAYFLLRQPEAPQRQSLVLPSLVAEKPRPDDALGLEQHRTPTLPPVGPANRIEITRGGQKLELRRIAEDSWKIVAPIDAVAENYKVSSMLRAFEDETVSTFSTPASGDLSRFGLDETQRIRVALYKDDQPLYDLYVGLVDKPEADSAQADTHVMRPDGDTVFRMKGKDLRSPFDISLDELRDKRIFDFAKEEITRLDLTDSRSGTTQLIVAQLLPPEPADPQQPDQQGSAPSWKVIKPLEYKLEGFERYAGDLAMLRTSEFLPKLPGADASALDKPYTITAHIKPKQGPERDVTLHIGAGRQAGVYARLEGSSEYLLLSTTSAESLLKSVNDLRAKKLFSFTEADVQSFDILNPGQNPISLTRTQNGWSFLAPAGETAYAPKIKTFLDLVAGLNVAEYLPKPPSDQEAGFGPDAKTIRITLKDGKTFTIKIGAEFKDAKKVEKYYLRVEENPEVMTVMKYVVKNAAKGLDDLRDRRVFRVEKDQIQKVVIEHPDQKLTLEKAGSDWNLLEPEKLEKVDMNATINSLATLDVTDLSDKKPEEVGLAKGAIKLTITMADGSTHSVSISEEVKKDDHYAMSTEAHLQGKVILLSKHKVQDLIKKLPDFKKKAEQAPMPMQPMQPM